MSYGFGEDSNKAAITLPKSAPKKPASAEALSAVVKEGNKLGFVSREGQGRRKPGPKRTEPQGKLTLTGPKRVLDRLQARCDAMGGLSYWQAIEVLLDATETAEAQP